MDFWLCVVDCHIVVFEAVEGGVSRDVTIARPNVAQGDAHASALEAFSDRFDGFPQPRGIAKMPEYIDAAGG